MFKTLAEIRKKNKELGHTWFHKDHIRANRTKFVTRVLYGYYFIVLESPPYFATTYKVVEARDNGDVMAILCFREYATLTAAKAALCAHLDVKGTAEPSAGVTA